MTPLLSATIAANAATTIANNTITRRSLFGSIAAVTVAGAVGARPLIERAEPSAVGPPGVIGVASPVGKKGAIGDPGMSAYDVARDNGFMGTHEQWLMSLHGHR